MSIFIADDHRVVIDGVQAMLADHADLEVVGATTDGLEVLARLRELKPRVLVLDLMMPDLGGLEVLRRVRAEKLDVAVVVMSMFADAAHASAAFGAGANAYVAKQAGAQHLVAAIRAAVQGRRYVSPPLGEDALAQFERNARPTPGALDAYETLTGREREIVQLAAGGMTNAGIGARLGISKRTVESHRANLLRKLGLRSPTELVRFAVRRGLIPPE